METCTIGCQLIMLMNTKTKNKNQKLNPKKYENPTTVYNWMSVDNVDGYKK